MPSVVPDFSARRLDGRESDLDEFRGQVLLIVNTASECGFTPQYTGLERLYRDFRGRGFSVLGFPCNQFGAQEPGDATAIAAFCTTVYDITFPLFERIEVNGENTHPLYRHLKQTCPGILGTEAIKWNFTKFLVGRNGEVIDRFAPTVTPEELRPAIERLL